MANIVITSTSNSILFDFGAYSGDIGATNAVYLKSQVKHFKINVSGFVEAHLNDDPEIALVQSATTNCYIVDSINASAPSNNTDLYTKLAALIA